MIRPIKAEAMKIEQWDIDRPKDYPANARKWSAEAVAKVARSIKEFGMVQPCVVDRKEVLIIGHLRRAACRAIEMTTIPVHVASKLTPAQVRTRKRNGIMDNRSHQEAEWDQDILTAEMLDLQGLDLDLSLTGFSERELDAMLRTDNPSEDDVPPVPVAPVSRLGDMWLLGEHRVLCGDSTSIQAVSRLLGGQKADTFWSDPPYGVSYVGKTKAKLTLAGDEALGLRSLLDGMLSAARAVMAPSAPFYLAHPAGARFLVFGRAVEDAGWKIHQNLVWVKDSMVLGHSDYHFQHEPILYGFTPGEGRPGRGNHVGTRWLGDHSQVSIFQIARPKRSEEHPTMKPVELVRRCLLNSTPARGTVYEPFLGSGSTLIACEECGFKARAMDIDPAYVDVAVTRWMNLTGKQATLEGSNATFEQVRDGRRLEAQDAIKEEVLETLATKR